MKMIIVPSSQTCIKARGNSTQKMFCFCSFVKIQDRSCICMSITNSWSSLRLSDAIQPSHPVIPFSCPQSFPASGSFPISQLFPWDYSHMHASSQVQFISVTQSYPTLRDPMNHSTPGLPVHHQHPEFTQTHVHWVGDAIQPSHSLSSPSPPAPNPSQHQSLFQWVNSLHEVAKVFKFQLYHQSFQWTPRTDF